MAPKTCDIRSLPNETLLNVFLHATAGIFPTLLEHPFPNLSLQTELERIANAPLLALSRVCSRWHTIAVGTSTLWSHLHMHGITERALEQTIALLTNHLERSQNAPLLVLFKGETFDRHPPHPRIFNLLAQYSHRWETAHFICSLKGVDTSALRGRLPCLKYFTVACEVRLQHCKPVMPLDFLGTAPCLTRIVAPAPSLLHSETLRTIRGQVNNLSLIVLPLHDELHTILRLASELPDAAQLYLCFDLDPSILPQNWDPALLLPSITSSLKVLGCRVCSAGVQPAPHQLNSVLSQLFDSLTLPNLEGLDLGYEAYPKFTLSWAPAQHSALLGLCDRSAWGRCLKTLRVSQVRVSEQQLMEILSLLGLLEGLEVGDLPSDEEMPLVTDSLLRAMIRENSGQQIQLVPRLAHLVCISRLAFTPKLFSDFVVSRLTTAGAKFQVSLYPAANSDPDVFVESTVHVMLRQLAVDNSCFSYLSGKRHRWMKL
ncbi:hypothetical protein FB45DRAFT_1111310 [Roridomyces roridus]|uniref:F-box domain-containing protein n=1 Tax=Roridomyces roridus TaxID=1738132 RepID=A0AAD7FDS0_9AGAR|nr:hypothetical protein FB45DRAFT_1111310 [Roridomyces roridus]